MSSQTKSSVTEESHLVSHLHGRALPGTAIESQSGAASLYQPRKHFGGKLSTVR